MTQSYNADPFEITELFRGWLKLQTKATQVLKKPAPAHTQICHPFVEGVQESILSDSVMKCVFLVQSSLTFCPKVGCLAFSVSY